MDNVMVFDEKAKKRIGILCAIPLTAFFLIFLYYLFLFWPLTTGHHPIYSGVGILSANYNTLFIMLATAAIITAPIFIYCLVLLARLKSLNAEHKIMWIIFLSVLAPIASFLFWLFLVKNQPQYVGIHPDIA